MRCLLRMLVAEQQPFCGEGAGRTRSAGSALKGEFEGLRRLRVGHYRVVYEWQRSELVILVVRIGHRREVNR